MKIPVTSDISSFAISLETNFPVTNLTLSEGTLSGSGSSYIHKSPDHFLGKKAGEYLEHTFQMDYPGVQEPPSGPIHGRSAIKYKIN